jgi:hypothetical protein
MGIIIGSVLGLFITVVVLVWLIKHPKDKKMAYCGYCKQNVIPKQNVDWLKVIFFRFFWILPIDKTAKKSVEKQCPNCGHLIFT